MTTTMMVADGQDRTDARRSAEVLRRLELTGEPLAQMCERLGLSSPEFLHELIDQLIVTVAAWKGGVGKTELAKELAWLFDAVLVDLDWDAGGITRTWGYRHEVRTTAPLLDALERKRCPKPLSGAGLRPDLVPSHPDFVDEQPPADQMATALQMWQRDYGRAVVVDTHPGGVPATLGAVSAAHIVIVPVNLETRPLHACEQMAEELQGGFPLVFIPNRVEGILDAELRRLSQLSETYDIPVGPVVYHHVFLKRRKLTKAVCAPGKSGRMPAVSANFVSEVKEVARYVLEQAARNALAPSEQEGMSR